MANDFQKKETDNLEEFVSYLKDIKGLSERTIYHYLTYHRHFLNTPINQRNISSFIKSRKNNSVVRGYMMAWLEYLGRRKEFDLPTTKTGSIKKRVPRYNNREDIEKVIRYAYDCKKRNGIILDLIYWGALRRSEVCTIKINAINWAKWLKDTNKFCEFKVAGKGNKERVVLMHPRTAFMLIESFIKAGVLYSDIEPDLIAIKLKTINQTLFKPMSERGIFKKVNIYSTKALGRDIRPHELRHARATHLEEDGATIRDIQKYLGHSNLANTEIYLHTDEKQSLDRIHKITKI